MPKIILRRSRFCYQPLRTGLQPPGEITTIHQTEKTSTWVRFGHLGICNFSKMGVSENVVYPIVPNGFADDYPVFKWRFHWEYTQHFQVQTQIQLPRRLSRPGHWFPRRRGVFELNRVGAKGGEGRARGRADGLVKWWMIWWVALCQTLRGKKKTMRLIYNLIVLVQQWVKI